MKRKMSYLRHETHRQVHITPYKRHNRATVVRRICKGRIACVRVNATSISDMLTYTSSQKKREDLPALP